jgi:hypothetical protein
MMIGFNAFLSLLAIIAGGILGDTWQNWGDPLSGLELWYFIAFATPVIICMFILNAVHKSRSHESLIGKSWAASYKGIGIFVTILVVTATISGTI